MKRVKLIKRFKLPVISPESVMQKRKKAMSFDQQPEITKGENLMEIWRRISLIPGENTWFS